MTKLKTLKDLRLKEYKKFSLANGYEDFPISELSLRQEAIKWVKNIRNNYLRNGILITGGTEGAKIDFIKHFFNLTEEDLK